MRGTIFAALVMSLFCLGKSIIFVVFEKIFIVTNVLNGFL